MTHGIDGAGEFPREFVEHPFGVVHAERARTPTVDMAANHERTSADPAQRRLAFLLWVADRVGRT